MELQIYRTIGTAGHVDHGKSTLVKALTGMDTDVLAEEKRRGLSIQLGFAHMESNVPEGLLHVGIVDVPGHERFIRNMLAGVTGIDLVLFVVAADDGIMPQTREHLDIVRLLGVEKAIFVITKTGLVTPERVDEVRADISSLIASTALAASTMLQVDSVSGAGVTGLKAELIEECRILKSAIAGPFFRLPVDRCFAVKGFGAVVTGTVASGSVSVGDEVAVFPAGVKARVRGIESLHKGVESVLAGMRGAINLNNISHNDIPRGSVVADTGLAEYYIDSLTGRRGEGKKDLILDCVFDFSSRVEALPVKERSSLKFHHYAGEFIAEIRFQGTREVKKPGPVYGRLRLKGAALAMRGDRFILRETATGAVTGGGRILLPYFVTSHMKKIEEVQYPSLDGSSVPRILTGMVSKSSPGIEINGLGYILNMRAGEITSAADGFIEAGGEILTAEMARELSSLIEASLRAHHAAHPSEEGPEEAGVRDVIGGHISLSDRLIKGIVDMMESTGRIRRSGAFLSLPDHRPGLSGEEARIEEAALALFSGSRGSAGGFSSVKLSELTVLHSDGKLIKRVLVHMVNSGSIVRLSEGVYLSGANARLARVKLLEVFVSLGGAPLKATAFRDALGCGRKLAIEVLEYFDREGLTLRRGDERVLRGK